MISIWHHRLMATACRESLRTNDGLLSAQAEHRRLGLPDIMVGRIHRGLTVIDASGVNRAALRWLVEAAVADLDVDITG